MPKHARVAEVRWLVKKQNVGCKYFLWDFALWVFSLKKKKTQYTKNMILWGSSHVGQQTLVFFFFFFTKQHHFLVSFKTRLLKNERSKSIHFKLFLSSDDCSETSYIWKTLQGEQEQDYLVRNKSCV